MPMIVFKISINGIRKNKSFTSNQSEISKKEKKFIFHISVRFNWLSLLWISFLIGFLVKNNSHIMFQNGFVAKQNAKDCHPFKQVFNNKLYIVLSDY